LIRHFSLIAITHPLIATERKHSVLAMLGAD
jgi:hypothetical protein